jgi:hypothetical protein
MLVVVSIALSSSLQSPPLGGKAPGKMSANSNMSDNTHMQVALLYKATTLANMPTNAMSGVAVFLNAVASAFSSGHCLEIE